MKKKLTRRVLSLVLAIVVMMSMAITASAGTATWTDGTYTYTAVVTESNRSSSDAVVNMPGTETSHESGNGMTCINLPTSSRATCSAPTSTFPLEHRSYLNLALNRCAYARKSVTVIGNGADYYVYSEKPDGIYVVSAIVMCYDCYWRIDRNSTDLMVSGTLYQAPTESYAFFTRTP